MVEVREVWYQYPRTVWTLEDVFNKLPGKETSAADFVYVLTSVMVGTEKGRIVVVHGEFEMLIFVYSFGYEYIDVRVAYVNYAPPEPEAKFKYFTKH